MIEMNPFYAHESSVGAVFDVATWSRFKAAAMAIIASGFCLLTVVALVSAWYPELIMEKPPEFIADLHAETIDLQRDKPWAAYGATAFVALISYFSLAASVACFGDATSNDYYFRVGPGGISLQVPSGLDFSKCGFAFKKLSVDIPMSNLVDWQITQRKQLGAMSRSSGNISASLQIRTVDGQAHAFTLDCFREPAFVIQSKINDALQMVPAQFEPTDSEIPVPMATSQRVSGDLDAKFDAIQDALSRLIANGDDSPAVIVCDSETGRFVQFLSSNGALLMDLPKRAMDTTQSARAEDFFRQFVDDVAGEDRDWAIRAVDPDSDMGYQLQVSQADLAARTTLEIFQQVYGCRSDFSLEVEHV